MGTALYDFDIAIRVKPEFAWVHTVEAAARHYLKARSLPRQLIAETCAAIVEATEQLIAVCAAKDSAMPFEVGFIWKDQVVQVHFVYDSSVPLNPHQEPNYEVPSTGADAAVVLEGLWLHIIKRTMDRVFFRIDGKRACLVMTKYCREEHKSRQLWVMGLSPKLRADLAVEHPTDTAGPHQSGDAIIHDTRTKRVLKLSPSDAFILDRLDGKNTLEDIYLEHAVERGPISPDHVKRLYETLEAAGMLENTAGVAKDRARWQRWLAPVFSIPRPDATVAWVLRRTRFMLHPLGVTALIMIGVSGLIPLAMNWVDVVGIFRRIDDMILQRPGLAALAYLCMLLEVALHEFAHGVTCKHFGGKVRQLGIMWYMAMFIFFCDTTSAWTFQKKSQRIRVSLAGPLVSWAVFGVTAWCAGITTAGASPWAVLWILLTFMYAFGLVMNFNPLIRMDAYYMLVDWTGIPNLQKKSFEYLTAAILGWAGKKPSPVEPPSLREKRIFVIYGMLSALMSFFFILLPFWRLMNIWMADRQFTVGGAVTFIVVALVVGGMVFKAYEMVCAARHREYKIF